MEIVVTSSYYNVFLQDNVFVMSNKKSKYPILQVDFRYEKNVSYKCLPYSHLCFQFHLKSTQVTQYYIFSSLLLFCYLMVSV